VVACNPFSSPAFASNNAPEQTESTRSAGSACRRMKSIIAGLCFSRRVPKPPGTTKMSGVGQSTNV
jgi:hypothetical protein